MIAAITGAASTRPSLRSTTLAGVRSSCACAMPDIIGVLVSPPTLRCAAWRRRGASPLAALIGAAGRARVAIDSSGRATVFGELGLSEAEIDSYSTSGALVSAAILEEAVPTMAAAADADRTSVRPNLW